MNQSVSKTKTIFIFIATVIVGFILFALPNLFFGISKWNGGLTGINLLYTALFQFITVTLLIKFSLSKLNEKFDFIGLNFSKISSDILIGLLVAGAWTIIQFAWIIPSTGGAEREDISQMISMLDGSTITLISFIALGVIGGGITEEIYNRGYFINVLKSTFKNTQIGLWFSGIFSIIFFCAGHLPNSLLMWLDILIPTIGYTILFIKTGRLLPSIIAHGAYNMSAILLVNYLYA